MTRNLTWENVLTYSKDFSDIHSLQGNGWNQYDSQL